MKPTAAFLFLAAAAPVSALAQMRLDPSQQGQPPAGPPAPQIRDIAPPVDFFPYPTWMVVCAGLLAALILAVVAWLIIRRIKSRPAPPPLSARERAVQELEALRTQLASMEPFAFSIGVSDVLRRFVGGHFGLQATRQTSPEFLAAVSASPRFTDEDRALLSAFLEKCDMIKFARVEATTTDSGALLTSALGFVQTTRP